MDSRKDIEIPQSLFGALMISDQWIQNLATAQMEKETLILQDPSRASFTILKDCFYITLQHLVSTVCLKLNQCTSRKATYQFLGRACDEGMLSLLLGKNQINLHFRYDMIKVEFLVVNEFRSHKTHLAELKLLVSPLGELNAHSGQTSFTVETLLKWVLEKLTIAYLTLDSYQKEQNHAHFF